MAFGSTDNVGSIEYDARISTDKLRKDAADVDRLAKDSGDSIAHHVDRGSGHAGEALKKFAKVAAAALVATSAAAVAFGVSSVKAFAESQNAIAQTEAVLKSTGGQAGVTAKMVSDLASSLQKETRYSDEAVRSAENMLLTFTNISSKTFPGATEAVLDMATAMGSDLNSTAILVGKALQDPVRGATALTRVGVRLSDSQVELIKKFAGAGKAAEAQAIILKELQVEFGGSAKAAGQTFAGQLDILKNQLGEVQESIGGAIVKGLTPLANKLANFVETDEFQAWIQRLTTWMEINLPIAAQYVTNTLLPLLRDAIADVWPVVKTLVEWFFNLVKWFTENEWVFWSIVAVFGAIKTAMFLHGALVAFQGAMAGAKLAFVGLSALVSTPLVMPAVVVAAAVASIYTVIQAIESAKEALKSWDAANKSAESAGNAQSAAIQAIKNSPHFSAAEKKRRLEAFGVSIGGTRAAGGPVSPSSPYLVGEQGAELFWPKQAGTILPNQELDSLVGGQSNVVVNVNMNGIISRSRSDERDIAKSLVARLNDELRAKHLEPIGGGAFR